MADETGPGNNGIENGSGNPDLSSIFGSGTTVIDPAEIGSGSEGGSGAPGTGPEKRKRGRPPGSGGAKRAKAPSDIDLAGVEKLLLAIHSGIASITKIEEINLDPTEAKSMAEAFARVARHYPVLNKISDKAVDHMNLFSVMAGAYGTRLFAYKARTVAEKARDVSNVTALHPNGTQQR